MLGGWDRWRSLRAKKAAGRGCPSDGGARLNQGTSHSRLHPSSPSLPLTPTPFPFTFTGHFPAAEFSSRGQDEVGAFLSAAPLAARSLFAIPFGRSRLPPREVLSPPAVHTLTLRRGDDVAIIRRPELSRSPPPGLAIAQRRLLSYSPWSNVNYASGRITIK